jgi:hypothetical protein
VAQGRLTRQMLADISRDRDVVSYAPGLDDLGRMFVLKLALKNGQSNVVFLPPAVAFLRESIRAASRRFRYRDVRRRIGEARSEPQIINDFLDRQPVIAVDDWDALAGRAPRITKGCEIHAFKEAVFLGFLMSEDIYQIFRLQRAISFYLPEMVDEAERSGVLIDLERALSPSHRRQ